MDSKAPAQSTSPMSSYRHKRFEVFAKIINEMPNSKKIITIMDVGGTESYWSDKIAMIKRDIHVTLLNIHQVETVARNFISVGGDARNMTQFSDNQFDIVHSNSVIEHVGRWTDMVAMAQEVARVAPSYFVQTPYFWFPIEPHARTAFLHWLPEPVRYRIVMAFKCGFWSKCATVDSAMRTIQSSELIDIGMMKSLFPEALIMKEKAFGLTKSIIAIK